MSFLGYPLQSLVWIISSIISLLIILFIAHAILSWINPDPTNPVVRAIRNICDPIISRVQPYIPLVGGLDFTPAVIILGLFFIKTGILPIFSDLALMLIS